MTVALGKADMAMVRTRRVRAVARGNRSPWTFYALAAVFTLYVAALYGPMICIYILSFQDIRGGLVFPMKGHSLHWFVDLFTQVRTGDVKGSFDRALTLVRRLADEPAVALVNSVNPYRIEGQKTAAFEVVEQLGRAPARLFIPVGNAGNITAYWRGFCELASRSGASLPTLHGAQAQGAAPLVRGRPVLRPQTVASAIRIGNPASWSTAIAARDESGGTIEAVGDDEIMTAHRRLAREEGLLVEPASAAAVALLLKKANAGSLDGAEPVVCVLTGHGLKDPEALTRGLRVPRAIEPTLVALRRVLG